MRTVFVDVDTQLDFLAPAGSLYVPGAEKLVGRIGGLNRRAEVVLSTVDAHSENDPEFQNWPPHCVVGTTGQNKPAATLLDSRAVIGSRPAEVKLGDARQVILEKQSVDCFSNPNLPRVLALLQADRYAVYGVVTEICVRNAVLGLLRTGKPVIVLEDAVQHLSAQAADAFFEELRAAGGQVLRSTAV